MRHLQHYTLPRRILFPYSGEEPLTRKQGLRVILTWSLLFPVSMSFCTLAILSIAPFAVSKTVLLVGLSFFSGVLIFGGLSIVVVSMSNRGARLRQASRARRAQQ